MSGAKTWTFAAVALVAMAVGVLWLASDLLSIDSCSESETATAPSPGSRHTAVAFNRNCGATTDYVTHVNLRSFSGVFKKQKSGVIEDGLVFLCPTRKKIVLRWRGPDQLTIIHEPAQPTKRLTAWKNVAIDYREAADPSALAE